MSEQSVVSVRANVMLFDELNRKWVPLGVSKLDIYSHSMQMGFRVFGRRLSDQEVVINCGIIREMKYNQATPTFHQWRDSGQVYGLNFSSKDDADAFAVSMLHAIDVVTNGGVNHQSIQPMVQSLPPPRNNSADPRQAPTATSPTVRPPASPVQNKSQQSGGSPSNPGQNKPQQSGGPPPPPPPPMPMNVSNNSSTTDPNTSTALGSALANAVARKANASGTNGLSCGTPPEASTSKSGGGGGGGSLMDEMAKAFAKRKAGGAGAVQKDGIVQVKAGIKPMQPPSKLQLQLQPKTQEVVEQITVNGLNNNHESGLEALKVEILREVRLELNKMKLEIIEVIKSEINN